MANGFMDYFMQGRQQRMAEQQQAQQSQDQDLRRQQFQMQLQQAQEAQRENVGQLVFKGAQAIANASPEQRPVFYSAIRAELSRHPDAAEWMAHLPEQYDEATVLPVVQQVMAQTGLYQQPEKDARPAEIQTLEYLAQHPELQQVDMARRQAGAQAAAMYRQPQQISYGQPVEGRDPQGNSVWVRPGSDGSMLPVNGLLPAGKNDRQSATQLRLAQTAKAKLVDLNAIEAQLKSVEDAFTGIQDTFSAGPFGGGYLPTEKGRSFDKAVALLKPMIRKLTRTPGEGSMSDYESKLAELANPSRNEYESVTAEQLQGIRTLIDGIRQGYTAMLEDAGGNAANVTNQSAGLAVGTVEDGYKYIGGDPSNPNSWQKQ